MIILDVKKYMYRQEMSLDHYLTVDYWIYWTKDFPIFAYWNRAFEANIFEY